MKTSFQMRQAVVLIGMAFVISGCSTVGDRIQEKQSAYDALPQQDKKLVAESKLSIGMTSDEVYMILSNPTSYADGKIDNQRVHAWVYGENASKIVFFNHDVVIGWQ